VGWLCKALLVSRSGYYDWKNRRSKPGPRDVENTHLRERVREEFARSRQTYGSHRIAHKRIVSTRDSEGFNVGKANPATRILITRKFAGSRQVFGIRCRT
jgi:hypothetical protein